MIQEKTKQWKSSSFNFRTWLHPRRYRPALGMWPPWWWTYLQVPRHCCGSISCSPFTYQIFLRTKKHDERIDFFYHHIGYWMILVYWQMTLNIHTLSTSTFTCRNSPFCRLARYTESVFGWWNASQCSGSRCRVGEVSSKEINLILGINELHV